MINTEMQFALPVLCAKLVVKDYPGFEEDLVKCLESGCSQIEIQEAILQVYLHDGYPSTLEGLFLMKNFLGDNYDPGIGERIFMGSANLWMKKGEETCRTVYAENFDGLVSNVNALSPDLANWMIMEGYGKVLSRPGLSLKVREFISVAVLTMRQYPRQLHSHLRGAVNAGGTVSEVDILLEKLGEVSPESGDGAMKLWSKIKNGLNE